MTLNNGTKFTQKIPLLHFWAVSFGDPTPFFGPPCICRQVSYTSNTLQIC